MQTAKKRRSQHTWTVPRKKPVPSMSERLHAAALDIACEPILQLGRILDDLGPQWFDVNEFDEHIGPKLVRDVVAMIYAAGFGYELAAAIVPYLVAESSTDGPDATGLEQAKRALGHEPVQLAGAHLERARFSLRKQVTP